MAIGAEPRIKLTESSAQPDLRCDESAVTTWDDGLGITIDCVLDYDHDGDHTDGDGTFWDDDREVEYR